MLSVLLTQRATGKPVAEQSDPQKDIPDVLMKKLIIVCKYLETNHIMILAIRTFILVADFLDIVLRSYNYATINTLSQNPRVNNWI